MGKSYLRISFYMYDCDMHNNIPVGYDFQFGYRPRNHIQKEIPKKREINTSITHTHAHSRTYVNKVWKSEIRRVFNVNAYVYLYAHYMYFYYPKCM